MSDLNVLVTKEAQKQANNIISLFIKKENAIDKAIKIAESTMLEFCKTITPENTELLFSGIFLACVAQDKKVLKALVKTATENNAIDSNDKMPIPTMKDVSKCWNRFMSGVTKSSKTLGFTMKYSSSPKSGLISIKMEDFEIVAPSPDSDSASDIETDSDNLVNPVSTTGKKLSSAQKIDGMIGDLSLIETQDLIAKLNGHSDKLETAVKALEKAEIKAAKDAAKAAQKIIDDHQKLVAKADKAELTRVAKAKAVAKAAKEKTAKAKKDAGIAKTAATKAAKAKAKAVLASQKAAFDKAAA